MNYYTNKGFRTRCSFILIELESMLEKTKKIEEIIHKEILREEIQRNPCSDIDFYKPDEETKNYEPPRKRMKYN